MPLAAFASNDVDCVRWRVPATGRGHHAGTSRRDAGFRRVHAARHVLSVAARAVLAARGLRRADRALLLLDSLGPALLRAPPPGSRLPRRVPPVLRLHPRLRHHPCHGDLDALAPRLLARRRDQGRHRDHVRAQRRLPVADPAGGAGPAQPRRARDRQSGARGPDRRATRNEEEISPPERGAGAARRRAHGRPRGHQQATARRPGRQGRPAGRDPPPGEEQPAGRERPALAAGPQRTGDGAAAARGDPRADPGHGPGARSALPAGRGGHLRRRASGPRHVRGSGPPLCCHRRACVLRGRRRRAADAAHRHRDPVGADRERGRLQRLQARVPARPARPDRRIAAAHGRRHPDRGARRRHRPRRRPCDALASAHGHAPDPVAGSADQGSATWQSEGGTTFALDLPSGPATSR